MMERPLIGENVLPADFDGVFRFTNFTKTEFKARWANIEYVFPAESTVPLVISGATPEEVQNIRKKFARELAEQVFYGTREFKTLEGQTPPGSGLAATIYSEDDLKPYIQRCLEPLPEGKATAKPLPKKFDENNLRKDNKGKNVTRVLDESESLVQEAST